MAGAGKTTLAASYVAARNLPCLWYQLDGRDADASTFFFFLGQAVRKALARIRKALPLLTLEYKQNAPGFGRQYFEELSSRMPLPFCMVFDNFEAVAQASEFPSLFQKALSGVSPDIHF